MLQDCSQCQQAKTDVTRQDLENIYLCALSLVYYKWIDTCALFIVWYKPIDHSISWFLKHKVWRNQKWNTKYISNSSISTYYVVKKKRKLVSCARATRSLGLLLRHSRKPWTPGCIRSKKIFGNNFWKDPLSIFRYRLNESGNLWRKNALLSPFFSLKHMVLHHIIG